VEAISCCETLAEILADAIAGRPANELLTGPTVRQVRGFEVGQPRDEIRGSGFVTASLHAALWAISRTSSFRDAVLLAANLGEDADTTAAVAGQIAGAIYGVSGIPAEWLDRLVWRDEIRHKAEALFQASLSGA
jgi:ADP-ribosyl-[dinitrogen reductase] hydrolase